MKTFFILAIARNSIKLLESIKDEVNKHNDIFVLDADDSYKLLTFKSISFYRIFLENCYKINSHIYNPIYAKIDDDVIINPYNFIEIIKNLMQTKQPLWTAGYAFINPVWGPIRNKAHEDYVPLSLYPRERLPTFLTGPTYFLSIESVRQIYEYFLCLPAIWHVEDVEITGILREKLNISVIQLKQFYHYNPQEHVRSILTFNANSTSQKWIKDIFVFHFYPNLSQEQQQIWNLMASHNFFSYFQS